MMEFDIKEGITGNKKMMVSTHDTALAYGSGLVEVFATPAMVGLMENTAQSSAQPFLQKGDVSVGTEINVRHLKATPVGMEVRCESRLVKVDGKKLWFEIQAWDEEGEIGNGTHMRVIVNKEKFISKL